MRQVVFLTTFVAGFILGIGCVSTRPKEVKAPSITDEMPLQDVLQAAQAHGGDTLEAALKRIDRKREVPAAAIWAREQVVKRGGDLEGVELLSTVRLYQEHVAELDQVIFLKLVRDERNLARQLGWQLAANMPSPKVAQWAQDELSVALERGNEQSHMLPQMANAVSANRLGSLYTYMRQGLLSTGDDAFVRAMIRLSPERASADFLDYLALAPIEELRQLTQRSINVYSCMMILRHLALYPAPVHHANYEQVFLYAVSRNMTLSNLANMAIESDLTRAREELAMTLARLPSWIQVAYIESARRNRSTQVSLFLGELRRVSSQEDVIAEIDEVLR